MDRNNITFMSHVLPALFAISALLGGCAGNPVSSTATSPVDNPVSRIEACKSSDKAIAGKSQCLQDDAACYQISDGSWCTGERGNTCPSGSDPLPVGAACPGGRRCFTLSESLQCMI